MSKRELTGNGTEVKDPFVTETELGRSWSTEVDTAKHVAMARKYFKLTGVA